MGLVSLREKLALPENHFRTEVITNTRQQGNSGTGAWNTGIYMAYQKYPKGFVSILDDDDEYLPNHLHTCIEHIQPDTLAVFERLVWLNEDGSRMHNELCKELLTAENFYIGNPGVQGSNMFFKTQALINIEAFDESFPNTTDRDLMIRFLWKHPLENIVVIENIGVYHYNHKKLKVNNDIPKKHIGLDLFYKKYKKYFSELAYQKSLTRAAAYFHYKPKEQIIICMPMKDAEKTIEHSIHSILNQKNTKREIVVLIGNDNSSDKSKEIVKQIAETRKELVLLDVKFGSASMNRNYLNEYARDNYPHAILIGRLDADDIIFDENTISTIEAKYEYFQFDVLLCGNKQIKEGVIQEFVNKPNQDFLNDDYLEFRLKEMSEGNPFAELPSCNTFIKPKVTIKYPHKSSAEDHWFTVQLLLQKKELNIFIDEDLIYCYYSLDGLVTNTNKKSEEYRKHRKELLEYFKDNR
jgi:glycosyltransferase involved in cell wall biosynthesis